jgi:hypothetical protein
MMTNEGPVIHVTISGRRIELFPESLGRLMNDGYKNSKNQMGGSLECRRVIVSTHLHLELIRGSHMPAQNYQQFNFGQIVINPN